MTKIKMCGIYCIRNGDKFYVGQSIDIKRRLEKHRSQLRNGNHQNIRLSNACRVYGFAAFSFEIIEAVNVAGLSMDDAIFVLDGLEQKWMDILDAYHTGYNCTSKAGGSLLGFHHSESTKLKMSNTQKRRKLSAYHKSKFCAVHKATDEEKAKISIRKKEEVARDPEKHRLMSLKGADARRGHHLTDDEKKHQALCLVKSKLQSGTYKGYHSRNGKFICCITICGMRNNLGRFLLEEDAKAACFAAIAIYYPSLAYLIPEKYKVT